MTVDQLLATDEEWALVKRIAAAKATTANGLVTSAVSRLVSLWENDPMALATLVQ